MMKKIMIAAMLLLSGCAHIDEKYACCSSCTTDYECEVQCEKAHCITCKEFVSLDEIADNYMEKHECEYSQSMDEMKELYEAMDKN